MSSNATAKRFAVVLLFIGKFCKILPKPVERKIDLFVLAITLNKLSYDIEYKTMRIII